MICQLKCAGSEISPIRDLCPLPSVVPAELPGSPRSHPLLFPFSLCCGRPSGPFLGALPCSLPLFCWGIESLTIRKMTLQVGISSPNFHRELCVFSSLTAMDVCPHIRTPDSPCLKLKNRTAESNCLEWQMHLGRLLLNIGKWELDTYFLELF